MCSVVQCFEAFPFRFKLECAVLPPKGDCFSFDFRPSQLAVRTVCHALVFVAVLDLERSVFSLLDFQRRLPEFRSSVRRFLSPFPLAFEWNDFFVRYRHRSAVLHRCLHSASACDHGNDCVSREPQNRVYLARFHFFLLMVPWILVLPASIVTTASSSLSNT